MPIPGIHLKAKKKLSTGGDGVGQESGHEGARKREAVSLGGTRGGRTNKNIGIAFLPAS